MADQVTRGGVALILANSGDKVCLQVTGLVKVENSNRLKLELTDGKSKLNAVSSGEFGQTALDADLQKFGVVLLTKYTVAGDKVMILEGSVVEAVLEEAIVLEDKTATTPTYKRQKGPSGDSVSPPSAAKVSSIRTSSNSRRVQPIGALNPYANSWTIKARVTSKADVRTFKQSSGEPGQLLNIELMDEEGTEIRCTLWHEAVAKYGSEMEMGKAYYISKGRLKPANQKYSTLANAYELHFSADTTVEAVPASEEMAAPVVTYAFVSFEDLGAQIGGKTLFDVMGVVQTAGELGTVKRKSDGGELFRRDLTLLDANSKTVNLTVWNKLATEETVDLPSMVARGPVVLAVKGVRATDFNGVSLSTLGRTVLSMDPDIPEANALREWFQGGGSTAPTVAAGAGLASAMKGARTDGALMSMMDMQPEEIAPASAPQEFHSSIGTVVRFATSRAMWYCACPEEGCNKKVTEESGAWYCESHQQSFPTCNRRYIASMQVLDHSGAGWLNTFNNEAELIIGMSADAAHDLNESNPAAFQSALKAAAWKPFSFKVKCKTEEYNGESRRRLTAANVYTMDFGVASRRMLAAIKAL
mmetsp:Transcript_6549/g.11319  ORF Transcript_6549/g.11319 Transcript_6549/m.11319 type:complete len:587 (-) Transcript_6549:670-2430(-)|eukprot:CAMPEP_0198212130 /NCGR_PEP_ID=MMETSP1445-20131203/25537_1 /TAXON_ID=36898 /ORGANISM="Pyramimonas sp., Strain CCMP2087" /LENGTH=586 /DNA_ID=CAMNT_0043886515 /DNA_START=118 /DNA_END=1878 /DNA_ORIENTATION=-